MSFNYDHTRPNGIEVLITYNITGGGGDFVMNGCWHPGDSLEVEFGDVFGLPKGQTLTEAEWSAVEKAILDDPPEYDDSDYDDWLDDA